MSDSTVIALLFSRIASSYDPLNRLFSLASDVRWRRILSRLARTVPDARVLDVCTGTADLAIELLRSGAARRVTAVDLSEGMLAVGRAKLRRRGVEQDVSLLRADAMALPLPDASVHAACCAFGLRNLPDRSRAIAEMARVVVPGGKVLILEFAPPRPTLAGRLFRLYLHGIIPLVGGLLSGQSGAYRYLRDSIVAFLEPGEVMAMMRAAGLERVRAIALTSGIAFLYRAQWPASQP